MKLPSAFAHTLVLWQAERIEHVALKLENSIDHSIILGRKSLILSLLFGQASTHT